ncbi:DUF4142 domain-containing protein [Pedobacter panaciterrae]|uniref:DUF4142 domain-containing protein n=1 Tax=Pedobacter panaciterrae TaxID=363849 RepID=UPI00155D9972|nr:DUF4142 domain-containing protein [Pedobacter panaciterrae]NQX54503.1 DUF4142 domain-containing protein [Pedobacter panaciterrae]
MKNLIICLIFMMAAAGSAAAQNPSQNQSSGITPEQFINQAALSSMKEIAAGKIAMQKAENAKLKDYGAMMTQDHDKANVELTAIAKSKNVNLPSQTDTTTVSSGSGNVGNRPALDGTQTGITSANGTTINPNTTNSTTGSARVTTGITETDSISAAAATATGINKSNGTTGAAKHTQKQKKGGHHAGATPADSNDGTYALKTITETDVSSALRQLYTLDGAAFDTAYIQMMVSDHRNAIALFTQGAESSDPDIKAFASKQLPTLRNHLQQIQKISDMAKSPH